MSKHENTRRPERAKEPHSDPIEAKSESPAETPLTNPPTAASAPRIDKTNAARVWALPLAAGECWAVPEEREQLKLASAFQAEPPLLLANKLTEDEAALAAASVRQQIAAQFGERFNDALFAFISRMSVAGVWLLVALAGLRAPGWFKVLDEMLLMLGFGFLTYAVLRYGSAALRAYVSRQSAVSVLQNAAWKQSALVERLARALALRRTLTPDDRGKSPDDELLDANAYRRLIEDGVTTQAELSALGTAISAQLKLDESDLKGMKIGAIAREAGIDTESAIFYRDLSRAAAQLALEQTF